MTAAERPQPGEPVSDPSAEREGADSARALADGAETMTAEARA